MSEHSNHAIEHLSNAYLIGQYIESLAHEVISNQDGRLQKANNDLLFFTRQVYLPQFGSTFCRLSIANILANICGRSPEALSNFESSQWEELLGHMEVLYNVCQRNDASKFVIPKLKVLGSDGELEATYFTCDPKDEAKNVDLFSKYNFEQKYSDLMVRIEFFRVLSFIKDDLWKILNDDEGKETGRVYFCNEGRFFKFIDAISGESNIFSVQYSEAKQALTNLLESTDENGQKVLGLKTCSALRESMHTVEFQRHYDLPSLQEMTENLLSSMYFIILGSPAIQQIGEDSLLECPDDAQAVPLARRMHQNVAPSGKSGNGILHSDPYGNFMTADEGSVGDFGAHGPTHSDLNSQSLLNMPAVAMDMNTALHNLTDQRERLRNDVDDPLQAQLVYASQAMMNPMPVQDDTGFELQGNQNIYQIPNYYQQQLHYHQQVQYQHQLHQMQNPHFYSINHHDVNDMDGHAFYGRAHMPSRLGQDESQDSLMADTPPRGLKSPVGSTSKKRRRRVWSDEEKAGLVSGYLKHGPKWSIIKTEFPSLLVNRTGQDLKDCFRNMKRKGEIILDEKGKLTASCFKIREEDTEEMDEGKESKEESK